MMVMLSTLFFLFISICQNYIKKKGKGTKEDSKYLQEALNFNYNLEIWAPKWNFDLELEKEKQVLIGGKHYEI